MASETDYYSAASAALATWLAAEADRKKDERRYDYLGQNTEAGARAGFRAEDANNIDLGARLAQQNPYTMFNATQGQNYLNDLAAGEDVGWRFTGSQSVPGTRFTAPVMSMQTGSRYNAAQTPRNVASELANHQSRIVRADPYSSVTPAGQLVPGSNLPDTVNLDKMTARNRQDASREAQLAAIAKSQEEGGGGGTSSALTAALGVGTAGGKNSLIAKLMKFAGGGGSESGGDGSAGRYDNGYVATPSTTESFYRANNAPTSELVYPEGFSADTPNYDPIMDPMNYTATGVYIGPDYFGEPGGSRMSMPPVDPWAKYDAANPGWGTNAGMQPNVVNTGDYRPDPNSPGLNTTGTVPDTRVGAADPLGINYGARRDDPNFQGGGQNWNPGGSTGGGGSTWVFDPITGTWMYRQMR